MQMACILWDTTSHGLFLVCFNRHDRWNWLHHPHMNLISDGQMARWLDGQLMSNAIVANQLLAAEATNNMIRFLSEKINFMGLCYKIISSPLWTILALPKSQINILYSKITIAGLHNSNINIAPFCPTQDCVLVTCCCSCWHYSSKIHSIRVHICCLYN